MRLEVNHVSKSFAGVGPHDVVDVLDDVSLIASAGEFVCIVGPSGCGKSTLLRLVAGLEVPTKGSVLLDGTKVKGPSPRRGMVFQRPTLFPWLTVRKNIAFGPRMCGEDGDLERRVDRMLELAGLRDFADVYPHQLSGGMAQRIALVRAIINDPEVMLLDEPLGALDAFTRMGMQDTILAMWQDKNDVILMVTHDVDEAIYMGTRVIVMSPAPTHVVKAIQIDLDYPRNRAGGEFTAYRNQILSLLNFGRVSS